MTNQLDVFQRFVADHYNSGDQSYLESPDEIDSMGDGLLKFLIMELSIKEDCNSIEEMTRRLDSAIRQLLELRAVAVDSSANEPLRAYEIAVKMRAESASNPATRKVPAL